MITVVTVTNITTDIFYSYISMFRVGGRWQSTFDAKSKFAKIPNFHVWVGGGGWWSTFDAKSKFAKIPNSHVWVGGDGWWPTFDAKFKFAKILNFHVQGGWAGGGVGGQLLMPSPNLLTPKKFFYKG